MRRQSNNRMGLVLLLLAVAGWTLRAQQPATADELKQAELDVPKLMPVLELAPGMTVADVGAGAMTLVMAQALGSSGRVYATDVNARQIDAIRDQAKARHLGNIVAILGTQ